MISEHFGALKSRLEEHVGLSGKVRDTSWATWSGDAPTYERTNYVILFGGSPTEVGGARQGRSQDSSDELLFDFTARAVGTSPTACRAVLDAVMGQFFKWTPEVDGRRCTRLYYPPSQNPDVKPDNSIRPPLFFADTEWSFRSFRASSGS